MHIQVNQISFLFQLVTKFSFLILTLVFIKITLRIVDRTIISRSNTFLWYPIQHNLILFVWDKFPRWYISPWHVSSLMIVLPNDCPLAIYAHSTQTAKETWWVITLQCLSQTLKVPFASKSTSFLLNCDQKRSNGDPVHYHFQSYKGLKEQEGIFFLHILFSVHREWFVGKRIKMCLQYYATILRDVKVPTLEQIVKKESNLTSIYII